MANTYHYSNRPNRDPRHEEGDERGSPWISAIVVLLFAAALGIGAAWLFMDGANTNKFAQETQPVATDTTTQADTPDPYLGEAFQGVEIDEQDMQQGQREESSSMSTEELIGQTFAARSAVVRAELGEGLYLVGPDNASAVFLLRIDQTLMEEENLDIQTGDILGLVGMIEMLPSSQELEEQWNLEQEQIDAFEERLEWYVEAEEVIPGGDQSIEERAM